jgi:hypothetical protein
MDYVPETPPSSPSNEEDREAWAVIKGSVPKRPRSDAFDAGEFGQCRVKLSDMGSDASYGSSLQALASQDSEQSSDDSEGAVLDNQGAAFDMADHGDREGAMTQPGGHQFSDCDSEGGSDSAEVHLCTFSGSVCSPYVARDAATQVVTASQDYSSQQYTRPRTAFMEEDSDDTRGSSCDEEDQDEKQAVVVGFEADKENVPPTESLCQKMNAKADSKMVGVYIQEEDSAETPRTMVDASVSLKDYYLPYPLETEWADCSVFMDRNDISKGIVALLGVFAKRNNPDAPNEMLVDLLGITRAMVHVGERDVYPEQRQDYMLLAGIMSEVTDFFTTPDVHDLFWLRIDKD